MCYLLRCLFSELGGPGLLFSASFSLLVELLVLFALISLSFFFGFVVEFFSIGVMFVLFFPANHWRNTSTSLLI